MAEQERTQLDWVPIAREAVLDLLDEIDGFTSSICDRLYPSKGPYEDDIRLAGDIAQQEMIALNKAYGVAEQAVERCRNALLRGNDGHELSERYHEKFALYHAVPFDIVRQLRSVADYINDPRGFVENHAQYFDIIGKRVGVQDCGARFTDELYGACRQVRDEIRAEIERESGRALAQFDDLPRVPGDSHREDRKQETVPEGVITEDAPDAHFFKVGEEWCTLQIAKTNYNLTKQGLTKAATQVQGWHQIRIDRRKLNSNSGEYVYRQNDLMLLDYVVNSDESQ